MIKIANSENVRAFIGSSLDTKPTNINATQSKGTNYISAEVTKDYFGPYIGQGSTFFEIDSQKVFMYNEGASAAATDDQWVEIDLNKVKVIINPR